MRFLFFLPFFLIYFCLRILAYYFDRTFRKKRFAVLQSQEVILALIDMLRDLKNSIRASKDDIETLIYNENEARTSLKESLETLSNRYGFPDIEAYLNRDDDPCEDWSFERDELVDDILDLMDLIKEYEKKNAGEVDTLNKKLVKLESLKKDVEWALINVRSRASNGVVQSSDDIYDMFKTIRGEEILSYNYIDFSRCGINSYFK